MKMAPIKEEIVFRLLCGGGVVLAIWQYTMMICGYAD
jgi:hypothetical protein